MIRRHIKHIRDAARSAHCSSQSNCVAVTDLEPLRGLANGYDFVAGRKYGYSGTPKNFNTRLTYGGKEAHFPCVQAQPAREGQRSDLDLDLREVEFTALPVRRLPAGAWLPAWTAESEGVDPIAGPAA